MGRVYTVRVRRFRAGPVHWTFALPELLVRVVSLACSNTEIVCALGCQDLLVGVDDHSDHPPEVVERLPKVGPDLDIDVEKVAALEPDLVLATLTVPGHEKVVAELEAAGLPYIAPEPVSLEDVYRDVRDIAARLDVPERGGALVREMRDAFAGLRAASRKHRTSGDSPGAGGEIHAPDADAVHEREPADDPPTVLIQWWPKPTIAPGRMSWTTDVLHAAGGRNPIGAEPVKSRPVSDEEVVEIAPDAIVLSWCGVDPAKYRPDVIYGKEAWADVPAVRNGHVFCVPEAFMGRPGPRLLDGLRALEEVVRKVREGGVEARRGEALRRGGVGDPSDARS